MISFIAEIKEIKTKKLPSLDMEYSLRIVTNDQNLLELGKIPADKLIKVTIQAE